ncbi:MAG: GDSL-type esterase/lipase family protein [Vicinamibacterales bacterium]
MKLVIRPAGLLVAAFAVVRCGGNPVHPVNPVDPTSPPPVVSCPSDVQIQSVDGVAAIALYPQPAVSNGKQPVSVTCSVLPGATIPVGTTPVTCTASDALQRTAACAFKITVMGPPRLGRTRFLAFGDSMTEGIVSAPVTLLLEPTPQSYPTQLGVMLAARYTAQTFSLVNAGIAGSCATQDVGRFRASTNAERPEVVLLMEGANDLNLYGEEFGRVVGALEDMVAYANSHGAQVFLATLPPQREGSLRGGNARLVPGFNLALRAVALDEGAILVDVNQALSSDVARYIGSDGLHPTEAGYRRIAETFFDSLKAAYEISAPQGAGVAQAGTPGQQQERLPQGFAKLR